MRGLNRLRYEIDELREDGYHTAASELGFIADEIERDLLRAENQRKRAAWYELADYMNKVLDGKFDGSDPGTYMRSGENEPFQDWLERCYIPRPTDKNGDPIKLGDLVSYRGEEPHEVLAMEHHFMGWSLHDGESDEEFTDYPESWEIVEPDSIEKLRSEMLNSVYFDAEESQMRVDEWLKRAEKLFKEAGND